MKSADPFPPCLKECCDCLDREVPAGPSSGCVMLSWTSFQLGAFWVSGSEAEKASDHHQRPHISSAQIFFSSQAERAAWAVVLWGFPGCGQELGDILSRGSGELGVELGLLGDGSTLWNLGRTLPCYTAALWLNKNKWVTYPTAKDRQWEVSVWYFHTQKSSPKLELQYKIPIQTSPAFCFHWLPSPACTHRAPSFPKENSIADKGHLSQQVITKQVSFCVCIWFLSQC